MSTELPDKPEEGKPKEELSERVKEQLETPVIPEGVHGSSEYVMGREIIELLGEIKVLLGSIDKRLSVIEEREKK